MFNKKQKNSKGFTLIELLVVIAIIGLLAGIVLVSLGGARDSAKNARIQGALQQIKSVAELVYNAASPQSYAGICTGTVVQTSVAASYGTQLVNLGTDIAVQNGGTEAACYGDTNGYCVSALKAGGGTICVDANGKTGTVACASAVGCP